MRARHVTSDSQYRIPFGAAPAGGTVVLSLDVWDEPFAKAEVRLWVNDKKEERRLMESTSEGDHLRFSLTLTPKQPEIIWYSFLIYAANGSVWRYGARSESPVGEGAFSWVDPPSFQITVYKKQRKEDPKWYMNSVVYQIFPDRFARGSDWEKRAKTLEKKREGTPRVLVEDWNKPPVYLHNEDGSIAQWDFYGGTLLGISEKLDYLENLGINCLYLNPIFEAQSNHRYDTADYLKIDPMLGDKAAFTKLCEEAQKRGISIILDGVFNHTGDDSRYFNRYGNYPEVGAWQSVRSPYRSWYKISEDGTYTSWWGVSSMPDLDETNCDYRDYICGREGVVRYWLRAGARGWRLDVADELPDDFIVDIKRSALTEKKDALLIGEVWEDATTKRAYDKLRHYFWGEELDATMNYPLRQCLISFLLGTQSARDVAVRLEILRENYPRDAFYSELNSLGTHDRTRILTVLGGAPKPEGLSDQEKASYRLNSEQYGLAKSRLWAAVLLQMTLPGVPCVYYGDEAGCQGYTDPYNRGTYPWESPDTDCIAMYRNAIALRKTLPVLIDGEFEPFALDEDVLGFWRYNKKQTVCVLINRSLSEQKESTLKIKDNMPFTSADDVIGGAFYTVEQGGSLQITLPPLGSALLFFHQEQRLQKDMPAGMGILAHISSLPGEDNPLHQGTLGAPAKRFVDWLAKSGQKYWQVLPVNPTDELGSPYAGLSAFAGNPRLLEGYGKSLSRFNTKFESSFEYRRFCEQNEEWLLPYATFRAIKDKLGEAMPWQSWPKQYRKWSPRLVHSRELRAGIEHRCRLQFEFMRQWDELHNYAAERGIALIGDMPIYVSADSADVWEHPEFFNLDEDGHAKGLAGAPPDFFNPEGQLWGNPTYRWDVMKKDGYSWWMRRFRRMFALYDYVRLDHFLGFSSYYCIPQGKTAKEGTWRFGPGAELFEHAYKKFGKLPLIAEDLGMITPAVRALLSSTGFYGMDVVQFCDQDVRACYEPQHGKIAFSSTHDTSTLLGWCKNAFGEQDAPSVAKDIRLRVLKSSAPVAMLALQDVIGLDDSARMNYPGVAEGNWQWRATQEELDMSAAPLLKLAEQSGRFTH